MLSDCGAGGDSWESPGLQGDPASPSQRRSVLGVHWKDWCWSWNSSTLDTWCEAPTHWKRPWWWEWLRARGEVGDRGWDGWMASPTQWTWAEQVSEDRGQGGPVCCSPRGRRVRHDWVTTRTGCQMHLEEGPTPTPGEAFQAGYIWANAWERKGWVGPGERGFCTEGATVKGRQGAGGQAECLERVEGEPGRRPERRPHWGILGDRRPCPCVCC